MAANGTSMVREASAGAGNVARIVSLTSQHWPAASISILIILIAIYVQNYLRLSVALSSIPIAGKGSKSERLAEYMASKGWDIYSEGYQKVGKPTLISDLYIDMTNLLSSRTVRSGCLFRIVSCY
jgi:hypothetical protein